MRSPVEAKPRLQKNKSTRCQFYWSEKHPDELRVIVSLPDEVSFPVTSEPSTTRFELAICKMVRKSLALGQPMLLWKTDRQQFDYVKAK